MGIVGLARVLGPVAEAMAMAMALVLGFAAVDDFP